MMTLKKVIEALVFASPKPISTKEILAALRAAGEETEDPIQLEFAAVKEEQVLETLALIEQEYVANDRAFHLAEQVSGWALVTSSSASPWVRQLYPEAKPTRLTGPQLETLAIVAYRQPVTRADIEAVRGVAVDGVMQVLLDRGLVKIAGRAELPGRPLLYRTTEYFLQHFGLKNTDELPNSGELKRIALPTAQVLAEAAKPAGETAEGEPLPAGEEGASGPAPSQPAKKPATPRKKAAPSEAAAAPTPQPAIPSEKPAAIFEWSAPEEEAEEEAEPAEGEPAEESPESNNPPSESE